MSEIVSGSQVDDGPEPPKRRIGAKEILQSLVGFGVAAFLLVWGLPTVAKTTWPEIGHQLSQMDWQLAVLMVVLMLVGLYCYTFTLIGSLPGLTHVRALMVNAAGSMVSNILPAGGAIGVALSYMMFRSWGFARRAISTSLVATGVWNLLARLVLPVLGAIVIIIDPAKTPRSVTIGASIAALIAAVLVGTFIAAIYSDKVSHWLGRSLTTLLRPFSKKIRDGVDLDQLITDQRSRMDTVVRHGGLTMTLGLAGMFAFFFVLYVVAAHTVGLEMPYTHLFVAFSFRMFLTVLAITPGGLGITEVGTAGVLVAFGGSPSAAASAALLYAIFTHLLEVPLGVAAWATWWFGPKRAAANGDDAELDPDVADGATTIAEAEAAEHRAGRSAEAGSPPGADAPGPDRP